MQSVIRRCSPVYAGYRMRTGLGCERPNRLHHLLFGALSRCDDREGNAGLSILVQPVPTLFRRAQDGHGLNHPVRHQRRQLRASFTIQVGPAKGCRLVGEAALGQVPIVSRKEAAVETQGALETIGLAGPSVAMLMDIRLATSTSLGARPASLAPSATSRAAFRAFIQGGPG